MSKYFDPSGRPIRQREWSRMFDQLQREMRQGVLENWGRKYTLVNEESMNDFGYIPKVEVSTIWLGLNHQFNVDESPLTWETLISGGDFADEMFRYSTREQAFDDHERIVVALRNGKDPWESVK